MEHREFHSMMRRVNGGIALRGLAREQKDSIDGRMADAACRCV